ncbi:MAG: guanitoxin biosynthesis L-enduracididine beta-hydroxylase GntD [Pseudomonadota bacterium]
MNTNRFDLNKEEQAELRELVEGLVGKFSRFDDPLFLKDLPLAAYHLPERLVKFLNEFKYNPPKEGYCVISTGIVNDKKIGLTPPHWELKTNNDTCQEAVMAMCLSATICGDIFGWLTQQDGRVIHDILPIQNLEYEQLGCGSKEELTWHTEDAFHELRGDYLIMMCLRNNEGIPTTLSKPDYSQLTKEQIDILFEKHFTIKPDNSHKPKNSSSERSDLLQGDDQTRIHQAYNDILNRDHAPEKIAILFGNKKDPCLRLDPYFMELPESTEAQEAFKAIINLVNKSLVEVALNPGEIIFIDNFEVVHGRRSFTARFDGTDRWYKRINVIRDIRRCQQVLENKQSRVIY